MLYDQQGIKELKAKGILVVVLSADHDATVQATISNFCLEQPIFRLMGEGLLGIAWSSDDWHRTKNLVSRLISLIVKLTSGETKIVDKYKDSKRIARCVTAARHQAKVNCKRPEVVEQQMLKNGAPPLHQRQLDNFKAIVAQIIPHFFNVEVGNGHLSCEKVGNVHCSLVQARHSNNLLELAKTVRPLHFARNPKMAGTTERVEREAANTVLAELALFLGVDAMMMPGKDYMQQLKPVVYKDVKSKVLFQGKWANERAKDEKHLQTNMTALHNELMVFTETHVAKQVLQNNFGTSKNESNHSVQFAGCSKVGRVEGWKFCSKMLVGAWRYVMQLYVVSYMCSIQKQVCSAGITTSYLNMCSN